MAVNLGALALSQQLLLVNNPLANLMFGVSAFFVIVAIMPVVATRLPQPEIADVPGLRLTALWRAPPVPSAGAVRSGLARGGFWGRGGPFAGRRGLEAGGSARFIAPREVA